MTNKDSHPDVEERRGIGARARDALELEYAQLCNDLDDPDLRNGYRDIVVQRRDIVLAAKRLVESFIKGSDDENLATAIRMCGPADLVGFTARQALFSAYHEIHNVAA